MSTISLMESFSANDSSNGSLPLSAPRSGFDLPLYGLNNGQFFWVHIPALLCTFPSFFCALTVIGVCFHQNGIRSFFRWSKGERLVVYLELCDSIFNISTFLARIQIVATRNHVYPEWLCLGYAFILVWSVLSQAFMVNTVAINAFSLMYRGHDLNFGRFDHRIFCYTFGVPLAATIYFAASHQLGPSGIVCSLDALYSPVAAPVAFGTLTIVFFANTVLYILTWSKISREAKQIKENVANSRADKAVSKAAKTMSLFVLAFFIQWLPTVTYTVWKAVNNKPPLLLMKFVATVSNLGGILNGGVYLIIRWEKIKAKKPRDAENVKSTSNNTRSDAPLIGSTKVSHLPETSAKIMSSTASESNDPLIKR